MSDWKRRTVQSLQGNWNVKLTMTAAQTQRVEKNQTVELTDLVTDKLGDRLDGICNFTSVSAGNEHLLENLSQTLPDLSFTVVLTRGGWHRVGGLMDKEGARISENLVEWLEQNADGDMAHLYTEYAEAGCIVTHLHGKTHYLVARTGDGPGDFGELGIEELQELTDHQLFNEDELPDEIDDLIEPVSVTLVEQQPVADPRYVFRRMTVISDYLQKMSDKKNKANAIKRFMEDWSRSSAGEYGAFSDHWVLGLREYTDAYGQHVMLAQPVTTHTGEIPRLEKEQVCHGSTLANMIHGFDRDMGYPMAWYFYMLTHSNVPYQLVEAIHNDQMGAYDYLPAKDLKVLIDWYDKPYGI